MEKNSMLESFYMVNKESNGKILWPLSSPILKTLIGEFRYHPSEVSMRFPNTIKKKSEMVN
jgi:hypothetical protein